MHDRSSPQRPHRFPARAAVPPLPPPPVRVGGGACEAMSATLDALRHALGTNTCSSMPAICRHSQTLLRLPNSSVCERPAVITCSLLRALCLDCAFPRFANRFHASPPFPHLRPHRPMAGTAPGGIPSRLEDEAPGPVKALQAEGRRKASGGVVGAALGKQEASGGVVEAAVGKQEASCVIVRAAGSVVVVGAAAVKVSPGGGGGGGGGGHCGDSIQMPCKGGGGGGASSSSSSSLSSSCKKSSSLMAGSNQPSQRTSPGVSAARSQA